MKKIVILLALLTMALAVSYAAPAAKDAKEAAAAPAASTNAASGPAMKADPNVYPLFSSLYSGGEGNFTKAELLTWNGCKVSQITNAADAYNGDPVYLHTKVALGVDWFGWGIHAKDPKSRDMKGFENGHLKFGLRVKPGSSTIKILVKHGYATESWMEITPALGYAADGKWHDISIALKDYTPKIKFGVVNIQFAVAQQQVPPSGGSEYDFANIIWTKD